MTNKSGNAGVSFGSEPVLQLDVRRVFFFDPNHPRAMDLLKPEWLSPESLFKRLTIRVNGSRVIAHMQPKVEGAVRGGRVTSRCAGRCIQIPLRVGKAHARDGADHTNNGRVARCHSRGRPAALSRPRKSSGGPCSKFKASPFEGLTRPRLLAWSA